MRNIKYIIPFRPQEGYEDSHNPKYYRKGFIQGCSAWVSEIEDEDILLINDEGFIVSRIIPRLIVKGVNKGIVIKDIPPRKPYEIVYE